MTGRWMDDRPRQDPSGGGDSGPPPLDDLGVDRLLDGQSEGADAVPGHTHLAELLAAAAGPARPDELVGEAAALAAFRAARDAAAAPRGSVTTATGRGAHPGHAGGTKVRPAARRRRPGRAGRTRRAPAVLVALAIVLGGLCASATAAVVKMSRRPASTIASTTAPAAGPGSTLAVLPGGVTAPTTSGPPRGNVTGPDVRRHDRANLCNAWRSGAGNRAANKQRARALQELAEAAGGADRVEAYCRGATPTTSPSPSKGKGESGNGNNNGDGEAQGQEPQNAENGTGTGSGTESGTGAAVPAPADTHPANGPSRDRPTMGSRAYGPEHSRG